MKHIIQLLIIIFFAFLVGASLSYLAVIPTTTPEVEKYQQMLNSSTSFVGDEIDKLHALRDKAMDSINHPTVNKQSLFLTVFFIPLCVLASSFGWYFLGLSAKNDGYLKWLKLIVAISTLFYFGYFYQPIPNIIGYCLGLFNLFKKPRPKNKQDKK